MRRLILLGLTMTLMGCAAQNGGFSERDKVALQGQIEDLEAAQLRQKTKITSLEKRISQLEDMVSMLSRRTSLDAREVVRIEPDNARVSSQFDYKTNDQVSDDVYEDIIVSEEKKRAYFGTSASQNAVKKYPAKPYENVTDEKLPQMGGSPSAEQNSAPISPMTFYQEGIDLYRQGSFQDARAKFEKFLAAKPEESYVDNALYWIGECFYGEGLFHEAAGYFHRIVQEYPNANKVPDALLKVALTYQKLGKDDSAREMLRYLMEAFPGTEAARIGKDKYEAMIRN